MEQLVSRVGPRSFSGITSPHCLNFWAMIGAPSLQVPVKATVAIFLLHAAVLVYTLVSTEVGGQHWEQCSDFEESCHFRQRMGLLSLSLCLLFALLLAGQASSNSAIRWVRACLWQRPAFALACAALFLLLVFGCAPVALLQWYMHYVGPLGGALWLVWQGYAVLELSYVAHQQVVVKLGLGLELGLGLGLTPLEAGEGATQRLGQRRRWVAVLYAVCFAAALLAASSSWLLGLGGVDPLCGAAAALCCLGALVAGAASLTRTVNAGLLVPALCTLHSAALALRIVLLQPSEFGRLSAYSVWGPSASVPSYNTLRDAKGGAGVGPTAEATRGAALLLSDLLLLCALLLASARGASREGAVADARAEKALRNRGRQARQALCLPCACGPRGSGHRKKDGGDGDGESDSLRRGVSSGSSSGSSTGSRLAAVKRSINSLFFGAGGVKGATLDTARAHAHTPLDVLEDGGLGSGPGGDFDQQHDLPSRTGLGKDGWPADPNLGMGPLFCLRMVLLSCYLPLLLTHWAAPDGSPPLSSGMGTATGTGVGAGGAWQRYQWQLMGSLCACWVLLLASFCQRHAVNAEYWRVRDLLHRQAVVM